MLCPNCGQETVNINGRHVCLDCGIEVTGSAQPVQASNVSPEPQPTKVQENSLPPSITSNNTSVPPQVENFSVPTPQAEPAPVINQAPAESTIEALSQMSAINPAENNTSGLDLVTSLADLSPQSSDPSRNGAVTSPNLTQGIEGETNQAFVPSETVENKVALGSVSSNISDAADLLLNNDVTSSDQPANPITVQNHTSKEQEPTSRVFTPEATISELTNMPKPTEVSEAQPVQVKSPIPTVDVSDDDSLKEILKEEPAIDTANPMFEGNNFSSPEASLQKPIDSIMATNASFGAPAPVQPEENPNYFLNQTSPEAVDFMPASTVSNGTVKKVIIVTVIIFTLLVVGLVIFFKKDDIYGLFVKKETATPEESLDSPLKKPFDSRGDGEIVGAE